MSLLPLLAAAVAFVALWLAWTTFNAARTRQTARAEFFTVVAPLFDRVTTRIEPTGFPRMTGHMGAHAFDLQAIPDSLTFRKLPTLWLMLTLPEPLPVSATLDIMVRPTGQEPFSRFPQLRHPLPCPAFLPEGSGVRSDNAAFVTPETLVARHAAIFDDPKVKELVISSKGLRLVILADEAERGRYLIFRDAEVGLVALSPARLRPLINTLTALRSDLLNHAEAS